MYSVNLLPVLQQDKFPIPQTVQEYQTLFSRLIHIFHLRPAYLMYDHSFEIYFPHFMSTFFNGSSK